MLQLQPCMKCSSRELVLHASRILVDPISKRAVVDEHLDNRQNDRAFGIRVSRLISVT